MARASPRPPGIRRCKCGRQLAGARSSSIAVITLSLVRSPGRQMGSVLLRWPMMYGCGRQASRAWHPLVHCYLSIDGLGPGTRKGALILLRRVLHYISLRGQYKAERGKDNEYDS